MAATTGANNKSFAPSPAFADALQRAKQIAAKIQPSSQKRPLEDGEESDAKRPSNSGGFMGSSGNITPQPINTSNGTPPLGGPPGGMDTEEVPVPDKMVGLIIGRGGEQITRLQRESGAKIQMAQDSGGMEDRICTVSGTRESINRAKEMIYEIVQRGDLPQKRGGFGGGGGGGMGMGPPGVDMGGPGSASVEINIPGPKVGLIIGKGGETIKQLQEKSGAKMVIIQEGPQQENEKPLRISGDRQKVDIAKQMVFDLLAEKDNQGQFGTPRGRGRGGPGFRGDRGRMDEYGGEDRGGGGGGVS